MLKYASERFRQVLIASIAAAWVALPGHAAIAQQSPHVSPEVERSLLQSAREGGPQALLDRLSQVLAASPQLAAHPDSAAWLAGVAAAPVAEFRGANLPVYRDIAARIIDAAPAAVRPAITEAVAVAVSAVAMTDPSIREPLPPDVAERISRPQPAPTPEPTRGARVGSFVLYPEVSVTEFWDNNIFATKNAEVHDFITVIAPHIFVVSDWKEHAVSFEAHTDVTRYARNNKENSIDYWGAGEGRYDLSTTSNIFGGGDAGKFHEDRDSPDDVNGIEPTDYYDYSAFTGVSHQLGNIVLRPGATLRRLRFEDTPTTAATINNGDRDRDVVSGGIRLSYKLDETFEPFLDAHHEVRAYRLGLDDNGFDRDSSGYRFAAGTKVKISGKLNAEVFGGWLDRDYDSSLLKDVGTPTYGGSASWRALPPLLVSLWLDRSIEETTLFGASSYTYTGGGTTLEYSLTSNLLATFRTSLAHSAFESVDRLDRDLETSIGMRYTISGGLYAAGDYRYQLRNSTLDTVDYDRHQIFLRIGYRY